jgi:hypothetical protein
MGCSIRGCLFFSNLSIGYRRIEGKRLEEEMENIEEHDSSLQGENTM